jgi:hypothetical protein
MRPHTSPPVLLLLLALLVPGRGSAAPRVGSGLPSLVAGDVTGQPQHLRELIRGPTLLVAITDRDAGDAMRAWFDAADARAPRANRVALISIGTPFFVSDGYARSRARERVPRSQWHASLLDTDHSMAQQLGLQEDERPYAFAVSGDGRVLAVVHGRPEGPRARQLWSALDELAARRSSRRDGQD